MISLQSKGLSRVFSNTTVQKHSSLVLSFLYGPTLTSIHDYWKTIALTRWTFVGNVMSLLFNILPGFVIAFSSKEQTSFNFMAVVTICSHFGAQENKVCHCCHYFFSQHRNISKADIFPLPPSFSPKSCRRSTVGFAQ